MSSFLFGKTNYQKNFVSDAGAKSIDSAFGGVDDFRKSSKALLSDFLPESQRLYGLQSRDLENQTRGLGQLFSGTLNYDPYADRARQLDIDLSGLERARGVLGGAADSGTKAMLARLGMSGRGGSYQNRLITSSIGNQLNPVLQGIFGGLNSGMTSAGNLRFGNASTAGNLINAQNALYGNLRNSFLAPMDASARALGLEAGVLNDLTNAAKNNFAGMTSTKKAGLFDVVKGINNMTNDLVGTVGNIAGIAGQFGGMGGGGGGLGGMFGGGGKGGGGDGGQFSGVGSFPGNASFQPATVTYSNASVPSGAYGFQNTFNSPSFTQRNDSGYSWTW